MAFSRKRGSNLLKRVGISSIWRFQKVLSGSSPTSRVSPTFLCKSRLLWAGRRIFLDAELPDGTTRKNERVGGGKKKTGPTHPGRSFTSCVRARARATATPSFIENRTTQNVVGEPLPPTSWPHITAPQDGSDGCGKVCLSATATMTVSSVYFLV